MRMFDVIEKKKRGFALSEEEIAFFVEGYTAGEIPDYQVSALCMAICFNGMSPDECASLTRHMMHSGDVIDLSHFPYTADKHSTGGVGDKTSLIITPTAAVLGLSVAKMSGRGLGHTGGTIDKLESIPGFQTTLSPERFMRQVNEIGAALIGQSGNLAPADKKLYALRDVTATVDSIPLIASSIMSKKLAAGAHTIVLDVKYGSGAFMKTPDDAVTLAETMVKIGKANGRNTAALITSMETPLGEYVGNSVEVMEAYHVLCGRVHGDLYDVSSALCANMVSLAKEIPYDDALRQVKDAIDSGAARQKMLDWISAQGGDTAYLTEERFAVGKHRREITAEHDGWLSTDSEGIGRAACLLGAGRLTKDDTPDLSAGIRLCAKRGDRIRQGDILGVLYTSDESKLESGAREFIASMHITDEKPADMPLIYRTVY
ncbi:MAG: thymidine phosphorylase [Clostridia bacterium]|nr:thymidine phosphorylase [Clostridia bacterium]